MVTFAFIIKKMVKVIPYVHSDVNCPGDDTFVFMFMSKMLRYFAIFAGSLEAAYSLNWGAREIWGKGGGETLALL